MGDFRHLRAWQQAVDLAVLCGKIAAKLPETERFALADQLRRASYSVVLNIAEGASRRGAKEFRRYLDIARGSLHEIEAVEVLMERLNYVKATELTTLQNARDACAKMVYGLLRKMSSAGDQRTRTTQHRTVTT